MQLCLKLQPLKNHSANFVVNAEGRWVCLSVAYCCCEGLSMKSNLLQLSLPSSQRQLFQPKRGDRRRCTHSHSHTNLCSLNRWCSKKKGNLWAGFWLMLCWSVWDLERTQRRGESSGWEGEHIWFHSALCFNDRCFAPQWPSLNAAS